MKPLVITQQITDRREPGIQRYLSEVSKINLLSEEEEFDVAMKAKEGDEKAIEKLTKSNLRFAISVAKQYQNGDIPLIELINAANQGLYESAKTYDPELGNKFISYAVWKTRARVIEHLNKYSGTIYIPGKRKDNIRKMKRVISSLEQKLEREPSKEEIYEELSTDFSEAQIESIIESNSISVSSYDAELNDDGYTLLDTFSNDMKTDILTTVTDADSKVNSLFDLLNGREKDIIRRSYGIGCEKETMKNIGKDWDLTGGTVRHNRDIALRKIKKRLKTSGLENFYKSLIDG